MTSSEPNDELEGLAGLLAGKRVAVTGANRGIGRALVEAFSRAGASLLAHARRGEAAAAVAADLRARPGGAPVASVSGDLRDPELGGRLARVAGEELGGLDLLFLNAATLGPMQALADTDFEAFSEVMEVNVAAQLRLFVAALPLLRDSRGAVVWMSSGLGHFALPRFGVYCASKHALEGLAKLAAVEHEGEGITSVIVTPGMARTTMLEAATLGADISGFDSPERVAAGFTRLLAALGPDMNGRLVEVGAYLA